MGYSPTSNNQSNLPQSTVRYYDKKFRLIGSGGMFSEAEDLR